MIAFLHDETLGSAILARFVEQLMTFYLSHDAFLKPSVN